MNEPERPLLLFPSLATDLGVEPALLFSYLSERARFEGSQLSLKRGQLTRDLPFWSSTQLMGLLEALVRAELIQTERRDNALLVNLSVTEVNERPVGVSDLPVIEEPRDLPALKAGPAPTFGGHSGWRRTPSELDEIFEAAEQKKKQLRPMSLEWRPSETFFELLKRNMIEVDFAERCLDEFIAYYVEKGNRESNWDQRFLSWVKRGWRDEEARRARAQQGNGSGTEYEKNRQDSRENRKRVTAAIMDLKNLDW